MDFCESIWGMTVSQCHTPPLYQQLLKTIQNPVLMFLSAQGERLTCSCSNYSNSTNRCSPLYSKLGIGTHLWGFQPQQRAALESARRLPAAVARCRVDFYHCIRRITSITAPHSISFRNFQRLRLRQRSRKMCCTRIAWDSRSSNGKNQTSSRRCRMNTTKINGDWPRKFQTPTYS